MMVAKLAAQWVDYWALLMAETKVEEMVARWADSLVDWMVA